MEVAMNDMVYTSIANGKFRQVGDLKRRLDADGFPYKHHIINGEHHILIWNGYLDRFQGLYKGIVKDC